MNQPNPFKWRHYEAEIILLCVRWYLRYSLSYRDLEEMMRERGLSNTVQIRRKGQKREKEAGEMAYSKPSPL